MLQIRIRLIRVFLIAAVLVPAAVTNAQTAGQRLILYDGSYQVVTRYQVVGNQVLGDQVRYLSAERGDWEELPSALVDWPATGKWAKDHAAGAKAAVPAVQTPATPDSGEAAAIDREEQQERAAEFARRPEITPGLRLPDEDGVWAFDAYQGQPELVGLTQTSGNVNPATGHHVLRGELNSLGGLKQAVEMSGAQSKIQIHGDRPVFYVSVSAPDDDLSGEAAFTVDTHGASEPEKDSYSSPDSRYAIVRVESNLRRGYRVVGRISVSPDISPDGKVEQGENVIPTRAQMLPGRRWMRLTPNTPLESGEYALMEVLRPGEVNLSVWDFRVDPEAPDNKHTIVPLERPIR